MYLLSIRIAQDIAAHDVDQVWLWIHFTHKPAQSFPKPACTPQTHKQIPLTIALSLKEGSSLALKEYCDRNKSMDLTNWLMSSSFSTLAKVATLFFSRYRCPGPPWKITHLKPYITSNSKKQEISTTLWTDREKFLSIWTHNHYTTSNPNHQTEETVVQIIPTDTADSLWCTYSLISCHYVCVCWPCFSLTWQKISMRQILEPFL